MSTTTVVSVTCQYQGPPPLLSISVTSSDSPSTPGSSISGDLDDYPPPSGMNKMHLIGEKKSRFHQVQAERDLLIRSQIYNEILSELNLVWWCQLPIYIQDMLSAGFNSLAQLPTIFALWYLEWHKAYPRHYPLPPSMLHFGQVKKLTNFVFIFDPSTGEESELNDIVTIAWNVVPEPTRDLMLLCWCGLNSDRYRKNKVAHPDVKVSSAISILKNDFGAPFAYLDADTLRLANFLFDDEDD